MPTVTDPNLTLTESGGQVRVRVRYNVTFSAFERQLVGLGATYHSHVTVHDFDGGDGVGAQLADFPDRHDFTPEITVGPGSETLPGDEDILLPRHALKGDAPNNDDELKAKIRIHCPEAQVAFTADVLTDQEILND